MKVLRDNRDSLMAILEAFVYDPLLNWRFFNESECQDSIFEEAKEEEYILNRSRKLTKMLY